jgi:hypothetical protein
MQYEEQAELFALVGLIPIYKITYLVKYYGAKAADFIDYFEISNFNCKI